LRERLEDLPDLIQHLVKRLRPQLPPALQAVTEDLLATLSSHPWRGNIRELANVIEYALVVSDRLPLGCEHLPERLFSQHARGEQSRPVTLVPGVRASADQAASRETPTMIRSATLHAELQGRQTARRAWPTTSAHPPSLPSSDAALSGSSAGTDRPLSLRELEMQAILSGLERNQGNKIRTAEELGISIKTLYNKLNQYAEDRAPS
jgi:DNA-binding NtrC family response regulator